MSFRLNGRTLNASNFKKEFEAATIKFIKSELRERYRAIRHPDTGEFPTVLVHGETLDDLRVSIEGSPELLAIISERMSIEEQNTATFVPMQNNPPKAFLSYSFDDRDIADRVARALMTSGIDTWWAEWEIGSGDSLRQKIDNGLETCTHFIVLLTPSAMRKPWVQQEMDAGLIRRISGQARFIPLRHNLSAGDLPPLLSGILSPEIDILHFDQGMLNLVNDIHGVSRKPPLGPTPSNTAIPTTGYSKLATGIAKFFCSKTGGALFGDTQISISELANSLNSSEEDVKDALYELRDFVKISYDIILPKTELFAIFDKYFMDYSPEKDALRIAADLINDPSMPIDTTQVAQRYGWSPRRMNPALAYLLARGLIVDYAVIDSEYVSFRVAKTESTRRFVKSRL